MFSINISNSLKDLGQRLRRIRLDRDESQQRFAARLGTSIPTLRKMENGDPGVSIGLWLDALYLVDRLSDIDHLLKSSKHYLIDGTDTALKNAAEHPRNTDHEKDQYLADI